MLIVLTAFTTANTAQNSEQIPAVGGDKYGESEKWSKIEGDIFMGFKVELNVGRICIGYRGSKTGNLSVKLEYDAMNTAGKPDIIPSIKEKLKEIESIIASGILSPSNDDVASYFQCQNL